MVASFSDKNGIVVKKLGDSCPICGESNDWCFWMDRDVKDAIACGKAKSIPAGWEQSGTAKDGRPIYRTLESKKTRNSDRGPCSYSPKKKAKPKAKPLTFPEAIEIQRLPLSDGPQWQATERKNSRDSNGFEQKIEYIYSDPATGTPVGRVTRQQWSDRREAYSGKTKTFCQHHWNGKEWEKGKGDRPWPLYQEKEACEGEAIILVEGELCVEAMRSLGLKAACNQGGGGANIQNAVDRLKLYQPKLVICVGDNDAAGKDAARKTAEQLTANGIATIHFSWADIHGGLEDKGDIADIISYYESEGIEREAIAERIREKIENKANQRLQEIAANPPTPEPEMQSNVIPFPYDEYSLEDYENALEALSSENLSELQESIKIGALSQRFRKSAKEVKADLELWKRDKEQEIENHDLFEKIESLNDLEASTRQIKLQDYLDGKLSKALALRAKFLGAPESALLTTFLPIAASLINSHTRLQLRRGYQVKPIFWSCIVGKPGAKKSPLQDILLNPINSLQARENEDFNQRKREYDEQFNHARANKEALPESPSDPRDYLIIDATSEAVARLLCKQPGKGILHYQDELKGLLTSFNQYRSGGKGSDVEKLLSMRSGKPIKIDRADGTRLFCESPTYSVTGGIQPDVLAGLMKDFSDENGFWARFVFCHFPKMPLQLFPDDSFIDTDDMVRSLYTDMARATACIHTLSREARQAFEQWELHLDQLIDLEERKGLIGFLAKLAGMTGEIALILHRINEAFKNPNAHPAIEISADTMRKAIALAGFYLDQLRLIYAEGAAKQGELAPTLQAILKYAAGKGWLTASKVKNNVRSLKGNATTDDIRRYFTDLSRLGMGETEGAGVKLQYRYEGLNCRQRVDKMSTVSKMPETFTERGIEGLTKNQTVDNYRQPCLQPQILTTQEFEGLGMGSVDNFSSSQNSQEILTHELTEENIENNTLSTLSTVPQNPCSVSDSAVDNLSTVCLQLSTESPQEAIAPIAPVAPSPVPATPKPPTSRYKVGDKVRYVGKRHPARNGRLYRILEVSGDGFTFQCESLDGTDKFWPHLSDLRSADG